MSAQLNHTIVWSSDRTKSSRFLTMVLGLPAPARYGSFDVVQLENGVALDFADREEPIQSQHYAFMVGEAEFDVIFGRIAGQKLLYWADPMRQRPGEINRNDGGRGIYFQNPDGHLLEVITRPYGSGAG